KIVQEREGTINKLDLLKLPNNFFIGSRIISNIASLNKLVNQSGLNALNCRAMNMENSETYSTKFYQIMKRVLKTSGTVFIYSDFREFGGLMPLIKILEHYGFKDCLQYGTGRHRYGVWSGDESIDKKERIKDVFNSKSNENGTKIKIILGSPAIKEGVSLLRVRQVHVVEPYWNMSRLEQVIGRAIRFCSHKDVEPEKS
ncbi:MAG: helicase-related protein, partial [Candidatus Fonsibacter sp.]